VPVSGDESAKRCRMSPHGDTPDLVDRRPAGG
jgi:hypothetical protein